MSEGAVYAGIDLGGKFHQIQVTDGRSHSVGRSFRIGRGRQALKDLDSELGNRVGEREKVYTKKCLLDEEDNIYVLGLGGPGGPVTKVEKFAPDGTGLWTYYDADGIGGPVNFKFAPDGDLVIAGRSIYGSVNGYARIDRNGQKVWSYPGVYSLTVGDAAGDDAGNTYLVHGVYAMNGGTTIKKLSPSGALLWSNDYAMRAFRIEVGSDQCPVICGFPGSGTLGAAFLKVDGNGTQLWANLFMAGGTTARLRQFDPASTPAAEADGPGTPALRVSAPNPFRATTAVQYRLPAESRIELTLFDSMGRVVRMLARGVEGPGWRMASVDGNDLPGGVYYCRLTTDEHQAVTTKLTVVN